MHPARHCAHRQRLGLRVTAALLEVQNISKRYGARRSGLFQKKLVLDALRGVSLRLTPCRNFGLVGESGSGKSTLARLVMALERPDQGRVLFEGEDLHALPRPILRNRRQHFQMVFQDPYGSLDPRHRIGRIVAEPLTALAQCRAAETLDAVIEVLQSVGLQAADRHKYPHEFSGGQRQRVALARALISRPKLIVADEPVSALDLSIQAQILNLLRDLQDHFGLTYLLISHDLAVVEYLCDEVAVMFAGKIVEQAPPNLLFQRPAHPYTRQLMDALPKMRRRQPSPGISEPSHAVSGDGCPYAGRCPHVATRCLAVDPPLMAVADAHLSACHFARDVMAQHRPIG
jgi:peptide/nickel transport system ATP-binding protein